MTKVELSVSKRIRPVACAPLILDIRDGETLSVLMREATGLAETGSRAGGWGLGGDEDAGGLDVEQAERRQAQGGQEVAG